MVPVLLVNQFLETTTGKFICKVFPRSGLWFSLTIQKYKVYSMLYFTLISCKNCLCK